MIRVGVLYIFLFVKAGLDVIAYKVVLWVRQRRGCTL